MEVNGHFLICLKHKPYILKLDVIQNKFNKIMLTHILFASCGYTI